MAAAVLLLLTAGLLYQVYMETHFQIYDAALRFHVRAASDLPAEQQLKLKVRDEVLASLKSAADRAESAGELKEEVEAMLPDLARTAAETLRANGSGNSVRVSVSRERFPMRRYGKMVFPAGVYEALRVDIGPAKGITGGVQFTRNYAIMQRNLLPCQRREKGTWKKTFPTKRSRCFSEREDVFG